MISVVNMAVAPTAIYDNKKVIVESCSSFTDCISEVSNTQVDNAKDSHVVMSMYNLIEYSNIYSEKLRSLWQHYRAEPIINEAGFITDFNDNDNSDSFKFKHKLTGQIADDGTSYVEMMMSLNYLSNF